MTNSATTGTAPPSPSGPGPDAVHGRGAEGTEATEGSDAPADWSGLGVNALSQPLLADLLARTAECRIAVRDGPQGIRLVDAGIGVPGSVAAGLAVARICMGGLGGVALGRKGVG